MKNILRNYLQKEVERYNNVLAQNSISDEDRLSIEAAIQSLQETMEAVDAAEDNSAVEELQATVAELRNSLEAIKEKLSQTKREIPMETITENYLKTQNSVSDFLGAIRTSRNGEEFKKNWKNVLAQNSISITEGSEFGYLPELVKGKIQDLWEKKADWLTALKTVNAKGYTVRFNEMSKFDADARAKGWRPGCTKTEQAIELAAKKVVPQFIYKIQTIDAEMKFNDDGSLLDYIVSELVSQILFEEKVAILIGDGRDEGCGKIESIEPIYKGESAETDAFTTVITAKSDFLIDDLHDLVASVHTDGVDNVYVFIAKSLINQATRVAASSTSTPIYLDDEQLARQIRAERIIVTDILDQVGLVAIAMIPDKYVLVGENVLNPSLFNQHDIWSNTDVYRYECAVAGAIEGLKSTAVLLPKEEGNDADDDNNGGN